jgi:trk system potassium uptake protein TrkA
MKKALKLWSEGIDFYIAVNCDQYGPFRIGPAYPINFTERAIPPESKYAHFGTYVLDPEYSMFINNVPQNVSIPQLSVPYERDRLIKMREKYRANYLICTVQRDNKVFIPDGHFVLKQGDRIGLVATHSEIAKLLGWLGLLRKQAKSVMILGGGKTSYYLAKKLINLGVDVKIIENDEKKCYELAEQFPKAAIICGDATNPDLLDEEGIDSTYACVVMTANDQTNFIISMFAKTRNVDKVISKIGSQTFIKLSKNAGISSNITPHMLVSSKVLRYIRGLANRGEEGSLSQIKSLHRMADGKVEALEFDVAEDFDEVGIALRNIKLKKNVLIAAIIRENNVIYPGGDTKLEIGDSVIVMTTNEHTRFLGDITRGV